MNWSRTTRRASILAVAWVLAAGGPGCGDLRRLIIGGWNADYKIEGSPALKAEFSGNDAAREKIHVELNPVVVGTREPTDIQFSPGQSEPMFVLEKAGRLVWHKQGGQTGTVLTLPVLTESEEGLLGMAFHPQFPKNGKFYLSYVVKAGGTDTSVIGEWIFPNPADVTRGKPSRVRTILEVAQPYQNHKAGQLTFGPDEMLYIGWGDGGWRADPHGNGQNPKTMLGKMLRIDVGGKTGRKEYAIPRDNPFAAQPSHLPEIFATGLRNPWRYSFDPKGRLIVADVGQDMWEEIDILEAGGNYGWNIREGLHCYKPPEGCPGGFREPVYEYGREDGRSITGGYVYTGQRVSPLRGLYVFGDFVTGRIWAIPLPARSNDKVATAKALGRWPLLLSTFGRDGNGELYAADFGSGTIYRIDPRR